MTVKAIGMNKMSKIARKLTHALYPQSYQWITVVFGPISWKYGWKRRTKLTCDLESTRCKIAPGTDRLRIAYNAKRGKHLQVAVCTQLRQLTGWPGRTKLVGALDSTDRKKVRGAYDRGLAGNQCLPRTPWRLGTENLEPKTAAEGEVGTKPECYLESTDRSRGTPSHSGFGS